MSPSSARALGALIVARVVTEAIAFACLAALAQAFTGGSAPLSLSAATIGIAGLSLVLVAALRETMTGERGSAVIVVTLAISIAVAFVLPARDLDFVGWLGRLVIFGLVGEAFLWRVVSIARGVVRWSEARNAAPFAIAAVALVALLPLPLDRTALPALALALVGAAAIALSLARALEELSLTGETTPHATTRLSSLTSVLFAIGVVGLVLAVLTPYAEQLLEDASGTIATFYDTAIFYLLLPLGFLAAAFLYLIEPLVKGVDFSFLRRNIQPMSPEEQAEAIRQIERNRPFVVGGFEVLIVVIAILVGLVLLERVMRERRLMLPGSADLERDAAGGLTLRDTLRELLPERPARRRPPRDDGSPAASLRVAYWRLLAAGERAGHGWRERGETPAEHHRRIARADPRFAAAAPVVAAFEDLRYGERSPDRATAERARATVHELETAIRT